MNRRAAIAATVLSSLGVKAAPARADENTQWVDVLTGLPIPGTEAPIEYRIIKFGAQDIESTYVFSVQGPGSYDPCFIGVDSRDLATWTEAVNRNLRQLLI